MAEYKDNYIAINKANWDERAPEVRLEDVR